MATHEYQDTRDVSLLAFDQYMRFLRWSPQLTPEHEAHLFAQLSQGRCEQEKMVPNQQVIAQARQARDRLVEGFQGLVICIAKTFRRRCTSTEPLDLIQEGNIGLLYALEHYHPDDRQSFVPIASLCIRHRMTHLLQEYDRMIRVPRCFLQDIAWMLAEKRQLEDYLGTEPTVPQLAEKMSLRVERVYELIEWSSRKVESLEHLIEDAEEDDEPGFVSVFASSSGEPTAHHETLERVVHEVLEAALPARQREVIRLRYGLDEFGFARTQDEVGAVLGIQQSSVSSAEGRAKARLRAAFTSFVMDEEGKVA